MNFNSTHIHNWITHNDLIILTTNFENNDQDHFVSLSATTQIKEWVNFHHQQFERPNDKFLANIGHKIKSSKAPKITTAQHFENNMICGFEDGLILVWAQSKTKIEKNSDNLIENEDLVLINHLNEKPNEKLYANVFDLDYVFIGHTSNILEFYHMKNKNLLFSSSSDGIVKVFDMSKGVSLYHFIIDSQVHKFFNYIDAKKNDILTLFCKDAFKINLIVSKSPFSFSTSVCKNNNIYCFDILNKNFYCGSDKGCILVFDAQFNQLDEYTQADFTGSFNFIKKWGSYFVVISEEGLFQYVELNEKTKKIVTLFKMKIGKDNLTAYSIDPTGNFFIMGSADNNVFVLDMKAEFELYSERLRMREEEKLSNILNRGATTKPGKKKKGGKEDKKAKSKEKPSTASSKKGEGDEKKKKKSKKKK